MSVVLRELIDLLQHVDIDQRSELVDAAMDVLPFPWVPNPGPQAEAVKCEADELFFGGSAGGGKSDFGIGLALTEHQKSLILRRYDSDARALADRMLEIIGDRDGFNGQLLHYQHGLRTIDFGGCKDEKDKQRFKGVARDLIVFDEIGDFLRSQYRFIIAWNRSIDPRQRTRVVGTGNPPTTPEGLWVIEHWGAWLNPTHPNPAEPGELRWYTMGADGKDIEVDGRGPHLINGELVYARSRTFIRARLEDNPDLSRTDNYAATLAALPAELRAAYRDGRFDLAMKDTPWQCIPTAWVMAAQARWVERPPRGVPMCAMGVDVAQGGGDNNVIAIRYDGWYAPLLVVPGRETPLGSDIAPHIVQHRRDDAMIVLDCGGGYGGAPYATLQRNGIRAVAYKGAERATSRTRDGKLKFVNKRTESYWRFREALDPDQEFGSHIALPPDPELLADLTAPSYECGPSGIKLEDAEAVIKNIGRSPDRGTAVVLAWSGGDKQISYLFTGSGPRYGAEMGLQPRRLQAKAVMGRQHARR